VKARMLSASLVSLVALVAAGCGGASDTKDASADSGGGSGGKKLALVAYSTPQVVYDKLIPGFRKTAAGEGTSFSESFGASGDQSRAVESGQPADIVAYSLATDVTRLVKAGIVADNWASGPHEGMVSDSVVALAVRKGNPKGIHTWADLLKPGVEVLTPNPFTSGGARWNLMAAYGAQLKEGKSAAQAQAYVKELITKHVVVQDKSARDALNTFTSGKGDVLISYENEAITAQQKGKNIDYVIPDSTILIENPIAVTKTSKNPTEAQAFVDYALSPVGQQVFADEGYRPVDKAVFAKNAKKFPTPKGLFTIDDLGGWDKVATDFFDPANGSFAKIEAAAGVSTAK
jgi:sulfate/thiosulfate transport system substrate-binding protein